MYILDIWDSASLFLFYRTKQLVRILAGQLIMKGLAESYMAPREKISAMLSKDFLYEEEG